MKNFFRLLLSFLREISDENAYARYLKLNQRKHSAEEWRKFSEELMQRKYTRAKCC
jgi:hypothetical protein